MKTPWFLKGTTGRLLRDMKEDGTPPFFVRHRDDFPGCPMIDDSGGRGSFRFAFSIRGNAKQRRQQRRQIERWLNEPKEPLLCSCGTPAATCIGYQGDL